MEKALVDLAEAACGQNSAMRWSLSESILRRQVSPVFERCGDGKIPAETALDVTMDFVAAAVRQNADVIQELFERLEVRIEERFPGVTLPGMVRLQEFSLGLDTESDWATSDTIARREMYPMFVRLSVGKITVDAATETFCTTIRTKREFYLELVQQLTAQVAQEIVQASNARESADGDH